MPSYRKNQTSNKRHIEARTIDQLIATDILKYQLMDREGETIEVTPTCERFLRNYSRNIAFALEAARSVLIESELFVLEWRHANDAWMCMVGSLATITISKLDAEAVCLALLKYRGHNTANLGAYCLPVS